MKWNTTPFHLQKLCVCARTHHECVLCVRSGIWGIGNKLYMCTHMYEHLNTQPNIKRIDLLGSIYAQRLSAALNGVECVGKGKTIQTWLPASHSRLLFCLDKSKIITMTVTAVKPFVVSVNAYLCLTFILYTFRNIHNAIVGRELSSYRCIYRTHRIAYAAPYMPTAIHCTWHNINRTTSDRYYRRSREN